jgi:hypothetical protein
MSATFNLNIDVIGLNAKAQGCVAHALNRRNSRSCDRGALSRQMS